MKLYRCIHWIAILSLLAVPDLSWSRDTYATCLRDFVRLNLSPAPAIETDPYHPDQVAKRIQEGQANRRPEDNKNIAQYTKLPKRLEVLVAKRPYRSMGVEHLVRYVSEAEALEIANSGSLHQKAGHFKSSKWLSDPGKVDPRKLGARENYRYEVDIDVSPGTHAWFSLNHFESKPANEPSRYEIPPSRLGDLNQRILKIQIIQR